MAKDKTFLIVGGLAAVGLVAYFLIFKPEPEPTPPGEVAAEINSFTISAQKDLNKKITLCKNGTGNFNMGN